jgi:serine phosphatase RsbU (regulator of sigma subunit)
LALLKKHILFIALLFISDGIFSQSDYYIDSLMVVAASAKEDTNKLLLLSVIAENAGDKIWPLYNNEMGKLAAKLQRSPDLKVKLCAKKHLAAALNNKGFYFNERGIAYKAILYFNKALIIQRQINDKEGEAYSLSNLGTIYDSKGEIDKALEYYFSAIKIRENLGSKISLAQSYNNIGILFNNQNDLANALKYHFQSLKIRQEINDPAGLGLVYNNIGTTYTHLIETKFKGKLGVPDSLMKKSSEFFQKGYVAYKEANDEHGIALSLFNLADYFVLQADCYYKKNTNQYDSLISKSENLFLQSLELFTELNEKEWIANTINSLSNVYWRQNKNKQAKIFGEKALLLSKELGFPGTIQNSADILRKIYRENNEFENALQMSDLFHAMQDSIINENTQKEALSKYFLYQSDKQQMLTKVNQEKMELAFSAKTKQQSIILYFVVSGLIILALFGVFIYNRFKITQKQNKIIEQQKKVVEHQKHIAEESRKEIVDSINYAKRIQYALLASEDILTKNLNEHFVLFKPKDIVSGDFYWATEHKGRFYLAVCDSTGHGVPGAFMCLLNIGFLSEAIKEKEISQPNEIFNYVRKRLIESISKDDQQDGMDGILLCIEFPSPLETVRFDDTDKININHQRDGRVRYSYSSANNSPVLVRENKIIELPKDKMPVGKGEKMESFNLYTIDLQKNDSLYLYTDGYADQFGGPKGKKFKYKPLNELITVNALLNLKQQSSVLNQHFSDWKGNLEQVDDVLVIGIKI